MNIWAGVNIIISDQLGTQLGEKYTGDEEEQVWTRVIIIIIIIVIIIIMIVIW